MTSTIRRDLFAVKILTDADVGTGSESWSIEAICESLASAKRFIRERINPRRDFPLVPPIIVHPSQRTVDVFALCGNEVQS